MHRTTVLAVSVLALVMGVAAASPSPARELVGKTQAVFRWQPAQGPVAGYVLYVSRNGGPFVRVRGETIPPATRRATLRGRFDETARVRVAAVDASGREGPPSPASEPVTFVDPESPGGSGRSGSAAGSGGSLVLTGGDLQGAHGWSHDVTVSSKPTRVGLSGEIAEPVVLAGPPTRNGGQPGVLQLRNVTRYGFTAAFREWSYLDGGHAEEHAPFLVVPAGHGVLADGTTWEAGRFVLRGPRAFRWTRFQSRFPGRPAVFLTVQTSNGDAPVAVRARAVDEGGFEAALFPEEGHSGEVPPETVGYVAIHSERGSGRLAEGSGDVPFLLRRVPAVAGSAAFLGSVLRIEEEQSFDEETEHTQEALDVLALGPHLFAQDVSTRGFNAMSLRRLPPPEDAGFEWGTIPAVDDRWHTVPFGRAFEDPVLVVGSPGASEDDPPVVRVRDLGPRGFEVTLDEWIYLDGAHGGEPLRYMVAERGVHAVGGGAGLLLEASSVETGALLRDGGTGVPITAPFDAPPAIFAGIASRRGGQPVVPRVYALSPSGFRVALQEEEALADGHVPERVDWIALRTGSTAAAPGRRVRVGLAEVDGYWNRVHASDPSEPGALDPLTALATADGVHGDNPIQVRVVQPHRGRVWVRLQEERSLDPEVDHLTEEVAVFLGE